jgi:hypothetical protein
VVASDWWNVSPDISYRSGSGTSLIKQYPASSASTNGTPYDRQHTHRGLQIIAGTKYLLMLDNRDASRQRRIGIGELILQDYPFLTLNEQQSSPLFAQRGYKQQTCLPQVDG